MTASRWWFPDQGFTPLQLEQARAFIAESPVRDRIVAALATGSPAVGLGHARSDLDLFLVFDTKEAQAGFSSYPRQFQGTTVDIRLLTVADLEQQLHLMRSREAVVPLDRSLFSVGNLLAWALLTRLASATVLEATPEARTLLASLDRGTVRRSLMVLHALHLGSYVEDAEGCLESGDLATAVSAAEDALRSAIEIALAALGDVYVGPKYLRRRMARNPSLAVLLDEHGERMLGQPAASCSDDEVRQLVLWRLGLAGHLTGQSLLTAWDDVAATLPPFYARCDGPVRSPYLMPIRWPGGHGLMTGVTVPQDLSADDALLWNLLDGRAIDEVEAAFAEQSGQPLPEAAAHVRRTVDTWRAARTVL